MNNWFFYGGMLMIVIASFMLTIKANNELVIIKKENAQLKRGYEEDVRLSLTEAVTSAIVRGQMSGKSIDEIVEIKIEGRPISYAGVTTSTYLDFHRSHIAFEILQFKDDDGLPKLPYEGPGPMHILAEPDSSSGD